MKEQVAQEIDSLLKKADEYSEKLDFRKAIEQYEKAVALESADAAMYLCYIYSQGLPPIQKDLKKAFLYCEKAAQWGDVDAMYKLAYFYKNGIGTERNLEKCILLLKKLLEAGETDAAEKLGTIYQRMGNLQEAFHYTKIAADAGNPYALEDLAHYYEEGIVVDENPAEAQRLFTEAVERIREKANNDNCFAQAWMGDLYYEGKEFYGIGVDYEKAVFWFKKAANGNDASSQNKLGLCYKYGLGVEQNYVKAEYCFRQASRNNDVLAMCNLALLYKEGKGVERDVKMALKLMNQALEMGSHTAATNLGQMYLTGDEVEIDREKGIRLLSMAVDEGEADAAFKLGTFLLEEDRSEEDRQRAVALLVQSATRGFIRAKCNLANCYLEGFGCKADFNAAFTLFSEICEREQSRRPNVKIDQQKSAEGFYIIPEEANFDLYGEAYYHLALLHYFGKGTKQDTAEAIRLLRMSRSFGFCKVNRVVEPLIKLIEDGASDG